jgi:general secretion pathway protein G
VSDPFPRLARPSRTPLLLAIIGALIVGAFIVHVVRDTTTRSAASTEKSFRDALMSVRNAITTYSRKNGHPPSRLDDVVRDGELKSIPVDPITKKADWNVTAEETVNTGEFTSEGKASTTRIISVHSNGSGKDANGKAWADY